MTQTEAEDDDVQVISSSDDHLANASSISPQCTSKGRKLTSEVWAQMTREMLPNGMHKAICNHCKQEFVSLGTSGTSHLRRHLETCPKRRNRDIKNFCISGVGSSSGCNPNQVSLKKSVASLEQIREALCLFVVSGGHPFSVVEEPGFKYLVNTLCPDFSIVSRMTVQRDALAHYKEEKNSVAMDLQRAPGRICFTTDNWRSENTADEFMCVTAHWIDKDWVLQKRIIKFAALLPPFDGVSLAEEILLCLGEWKITNKVFTFTLDNASYNNRLIASLKSNISRKHSLILDGLFFHMRCCCHIINLVVQDGLKLIDGVVDKIRKVIIHLRHSIPKKKKFYEIASRNFSLSTTRRLRFDTPTRWNSTFTMLDSFIYFQDALDYFVSKDVDLRVHYLSPEEWGKAVQLQDFLKTFFDVTNEFSASKTPTANIYFHGVWKMHLALKAISDGPTCLLSDMVTNMHVKFEKYWSDYNLLLSCAAVLDPRLKLEAVNYCYSHLFGEVYAKEMVTKIKNTLFDLLDEYKGYASAAEGGQTSPEPETTATRRGSSVNVPAPDLWAHLSKKKRRICDLSELEQYLDQDIAVASTEFDILKYWRGISRQFPSLSALARDILAIPISSVPSESAFSLGKKMITPCRSSLASSTIEALACYEDWLRVKGFIAGK